MSVNYRLYGTEFSLYTGKVRAYLKYKQINFEEKLSTVRVYKKTIIPNTGLKVIPVLETPQGEYIQDTSVIIDTIEQRHLDRSVFPRTPKQLLVSYLFEIWADECLLLPAMHYRWNKDNFPFIHQEFGKVVTPTMPAWIRNIVGKRIAARFKSFVPMLGITDSTVPALENWYERQVLPELDLHFSRYQFLLGNSPSLGDFCLMGPLYAHLYRDPFPGKLMREQAPNLTRWVEDMNQTNLPSGNTLGNDEVPDTLETTLRSIFRDFLPIMADTVKQVEIWSQGKNSGVFVPRSIGKHEFRLANAIGQRSILPFQQWKLQRVLHCYQAMNANIRHELDPLLKQLGGLELMQLSINRRVERVNNRLVLA